MKKKIMIFLLFTFQTIARMANISHTMLGVTLLSWGYSIGGELQKKKKKHSEIQHTYNKLILFLFFHFFFPELLATTSVAKFGFPKMAFFACISGPLLSKL